MRHRQLVNLSESVQLQSDRVKPLFDDLNRTLALLKSISELGPPWCKYLKASYVMALENSFKIEHRCREQDFREILLRDWKRKHAKIFDENIFNELIQKQSQNQDHSRSIVCWLENMSLFVLDGNGLPLRVLYIKDTKGEETAEFLYNFKINEQETEFFLGTACELLYNTFCHIAVAKKNKWYSIKEVYVYKQLTDWSGKDSSRFDKMLILGTESSLNDERISGALTAVSGFKSHMDYVNRRLAPLTEGIFMPEQDLNCTYYTSYLFKKVFDDIRNTHKV
ncbi:MAG: hypothetical protein ACOY46_17670 [Bacillota bacterium]